MNSPQTVPLALCISMLFASALSAAPAAPSVDSLQKQLQEALRRIAALEAKGKPAAPKHPAANKRAAPATAKLGEPVESEKKEKVRSVASKALDMTLKELRDAPITLGDLSSAFDVPDSPAAAVVGVPQEKVQHLRSAKAVGSAFISGLDEKGHFQSGLSIDFSPYQLVARNEYVGHFRYGGDGDFRENLAIWWRRVLVRTQISFATTKGSEEGDKSSKLALGFHSVLANSDDALSGAYGVRHYTGEDGGTLEQTNDLERDDYIVTDVEGYPLDRWGRSLNWWVRPRKFAGAQEKAFNYHGWIGDAANFFYEHASWAVGAAPLWISPEANNSYDYAGTTAWSSFAITPHPGMPAQFLLDVIYKNGETIDSAEALGGAARLKLIYPLHAPRTIEQDSLFITGGVRVGTRDWNGTFTGSYLMLEQDRFGHDQAFRYGVAMEKRISDNTWLTVSLSKDSGRDDGKNATMILGGMKIGLGPRDTTAKGQHTRALEHGRQ